MSMFYMSSLVSLIAAILTMLAKGCLNDYFLQAGVLAIDRRTDRQRKFDAFTNWQFGILVRTPPFLLRTALMYLACGFFLRSYYTHPFPAYALALTVVLEVLVPLMM